MLQHKTLLREIYLQSQICNLKGIKIYSLTKRIGPKEELQFAKYTGGPVPPPKQNLEMCQINKKYE